MSAPPPVLLIHGFAGSAESWGPQVVQALSARGPLIAVDLPGHGGREIPEDPERSRIHCVVKELAGELDARGIERAHWVGYSMGARVALAGAILRPGRVLRLVLESGSPGIRDEAEREARRREDEELAREIETRGIEWFVERWESHPLFAGEAKMDANGRPRVSAETRARIRRSRLRSRPEALARALRGYGTGAQPSFWDRLGEVQAPTLILTGSEDAKFEAIGAEMASAIPDARQVTVSGAGHAVYREATGEWVREVAGFLGEGVPGA